MGSFGFGVAELSVQVEGQGCWRQRSSFAPSSSATLLLRAETSSETLRPPGTPIVECDTWAAFSKGGSLCLLSQLRSWSPREVACIELRQGSPEGRLLMRPGLEVDPLDYPLDQLLTIHLLQEHGGLLLHAACVAMGGRAYVIAGPSGEGKTTFARAAADVDSVTVLTDERVVLRKRDGRWVAYGTPWSGEGHFTNPGSAPLAGIYLLEKSDQDHVRPLSPVRAMASLTRCHFPAAWIGNTASQIAPLEELVADVPCFALRTRLHGKAHCLVLGAEEPGC